MKFSVEKKFNNTLRWYISNSFQEKGSQYMRSVYTPAMAVSKILQVQINYYGFYGLNWSASCVCFDPLQTQLLFADAFEETPNSYTTSSKRTSFALLSNIVLDHFALSLQPSGSLLHLNQNGLLCTLGFLTEKFQCCSYFIELTTII